MEFTLIGAGHPASVVLMHSVAADLSGTLLSFGFRCVQPLAVSQCRTSAHSNGGNGKSKSWQRHDSGWVQNRSQDAIRMRFHCAQADSVSVVNDSHSHHNGGSHPLSMRALAFACLAAMAGFGGLSPAPVLGHAGHGDEFVQTGSVGQVKANPDRDQMLGIATEKPKVAANGQLSVPNVAIVKAYGQPYVFVYSGTTYDPVVIKPGTVSVNRTVVLDGVTADESIVVSGALSIFAESQKNKR